LQERTRSDALRKMSSEFADKTTLPNTSSSLQDPRI
jgi:hypothetical protein